MFKKTERLTKTEFDAYFQSGKRQHSPLATLIVAPAPGPKVAVVVGKKVAKSAVKRNLFRRRVYALLQTIVADSNYKGVLILILKPKFATLSRKQAAEQLIKFVAEVV